MATVHLYLSVQNPELDNTWNKNLTLKFGELKGIGQVIIIEQNESPDAQININYDIGETSLEEIEKVIFESGTAITAINIHFPPEISGVSDPYGVSALSIPAEQKIKQVAGVLEVSVSSNGTIKATINAASENKNTIIQEIIERIKEIQTGKQ